MSRLSSEWREQRPAAIRPAVQSVSAPPKYQLLAPLRPEELAALEADVARRGILLPVETDEDGHILDGHHRAAIARRLGLPCPTLVRRFASEQEKREHAIKMNLARRHLDPLRWGQAFRLLLEERGIPTGRGKVNQYTRASSTVEEAAAELGVPWQTARHRVRQAERYAALPEDLKADVDAGALTVPQAQRLVQREQKQQGLAERARQAHGQRQAWEVRHGDCLAELAEVPPGSVRLAFADPPYNQGIDYGDGAAADCRPAEDYVAWCAAWMRAVARTLTDDGSFWVLIADEYADHFGLLLRQAGLHRRQWLIWYEAFGVNCQRGFNRCSRHLFWMVKDPGRFVFHEGAVLRLSDRQTKYADARAQPGGKLWDSVWGVQPPIPRLVENSRERLPGFPTQLPLALLTAVVGCASDPGDLVLDPLCAAAHNGSCVVWAVMWHAAGCLEGSRGVTALDAT
jgi:site-specific DNA-methyltransferase (adenine-specific)